MEGLGIILKPTIHVLVLLHVLRGFCDDSSHEKWCYDLASCGPKTWGPLGSCSGYRQSPINIVTSNTVPNPCLGPVSFFGYENRDLQKSITNTGHYPEVEMCPGAGVIVNGLPGVYHLRSYHFHFGTYLRQGSEHAINSKRYSMELHLVHTKDNLTMEEAKKDPVGIVVVAFFIQKSQKTQIMPGWKTLADLLKDIPQQNNSIKLNGSFCPGSLLSSADLSQPYAYFGSLTSPNCSQSVFWIIFPTPILVTHRVVKQFATSMYFTTKADGRRMQNNFRPTQPLDNRTVYSFNENAIPDYHSCYEYLDSY